MKNLYHWGSVSSAKFLRGLNTLEVFSRALIFIEYNLFLEKIKLYSSFSLIFFAYQE